MGKKDYSDQFKIFASEVETVIASILDSELAKTRLHNIEGFSPNLILSLITESPKDGSFSFEQFKQFVYEYLGLRNQVELKAIIDLYSSYKSPGSQTIGLS